MRKLLSTFIFIFLSHTFLPAQRGGGTYSNGNVIVANPSFSPVYLSDVFSTQVKPKSSSGIDGSPFIFDQWLLARVLLLDDRIADSVYIRMNAYNNNLHFKDEKGEEMQSKVRVKEILIIDTNKTWHNALFRTGYGSNANVFYEVVTDGKKMQLLRKTVVLLWETKVLGEEDKKTFQLDEEIFLSANGELYKQNKKCSILTDVFGSHKAVMLDYISTHNIRCNKVDEMKLLVNYFNSL
jgi:hypothetical protein